MSYSAANMSEEARRYYAGGRRVMVAGVPCRMATHAVKAPGKDFILKLVASGSPIEPGSLSAAPRFTFTPAESVELHHGKPSARGNAPTPRARIKSSWWKPATISLAPYTARHLTDTDSDLADARHAWAKHGNPQPLRDWLADTAAERRAYWAAYDAASAKVEPAEAWQQLALAA